MRHLTIVTERWRVVRMDDNGNEVVVRDELTEDDARELCRRLEASAHKQIYWIERAEPRS